MYERKSGEVWLVPPTSGAALRLCVDSPELHLAPPYSTLTARAAGPYRAVASLGAAMYEKDR